MDEHSYKLSNGVIVNDLNSKFFGYEIIEDGDVLSMIAQGVNDAINYDTKKNHDREKQSRKGRLKSEIKQDLEAKYKKPLSQLKELISACSDMKRSARKASDLNDLLFLIEEAKLNQKPNIKKIVERTNKQNSDAFYKAMQTADMAVEKYASGRNFLPTRVGVAKQSHKRDEVVFYRVNDDMGNTPFAQGDLPQIYTFQKNDIKKDFFKSPLRTESNKELDDYMIENGYDRTNGEAKQKAKAELDFSKLTQSSELKNAVTIKDSLFNLRMGALRLSSDRYSSEELSQFTKKLISQEEKVKKIESVAKTVCESSDLIKKQQKLLDSLLTYKQKGIISDDEREKMSATIRESIKELSNEQKKSKEDLSLLCDDEMNHYLNNISTYEKFNTLYTALNTSRVAKDDSYEAIHQDSAMEFVKDTIGYEIGYFKARQPSKEVFADVSIDEKNNDNTTKSNSGFFVSKLRKIAGRGNAIYRKNVAGDIENELLLEKNKEQSNVKGQEDKEKCK
jgi:hypothetical protein